MAARCPTSAQLAFLKAGLLEAQGDIDGAIALYEAIYARDNTSQVIANNLASLIASNRPDAASLERAFAIARRLRGSSVPQFQDTYGWILHRRGDAEQALGILTPPPPRSPTTRWCSTTSPRPSWRSTAAPRRGPSFAPGARRRRGRQPAAAGGRGAGAHRRDRRPPGRRGHADAGLRARLGAASDG